MRNSFRMLSTGLVLVILGVILTVFVAGDMIDNAQKPMDYSTLQMEDFKEGMPVFLLPISIVVVIVGLLLMFMFIRRRMMGR